MRQLVVFDIEGQRYALRLGAVEQVLPMVAIAPLPKAPSVACGVINLYGQVVPVLNIRSRFSLPPRDYGLTGRLLVVRTRRRIVALPVDEVVGVEEVVGETVTPPGAVLPGIGYVEGIVACADGLIFIHDLDTFLSLDEEQQLSEALEERAG